MSPALAPVKEASETAVQCRHHWIIESPNGATSRGVCRLCGAVKVFVNTFADAGWEVGTFPDLEESPWAEVGHLLREDEAA